MKRVMFDAFDVVLHGELMAWLKHFGFLMTRSSETQSKLKFWVLASPWLKPALVLLSDGPFTLYLIQLSPHIYLLLPFVYHNQDYSFLCLLHCRTFPIRGFQIYDGPVRLTQSTFRGFIPTPERYTSAVGFNLKNTWQLTPRNNLSQVSFHSTVSKRLSDCNHTTQLRHSLNSGIA